MSSEFSDTDISEEDRADVAALADGSLPRSRRAAVEAKVARSPVLQSLLTEQQWAVSTVRGAFQPAPERLRARLAAGHRTSTVRRRRTFIASVAAVSAAAGLLIALVVSTGGPSQPTVAQVASLSSRSPTAPPPEPNPTNSAFLNASVDGVSYPNWQAQFGWSAVGTRSDTVADRHATTIYYRRGGQTIGYTIVAGPAISPPQGAHTTTADSTQFRDLPTPNRTTVTWEREGHTCVLSGPGVDEASLAKLGAWNPGAQALYQ